jgi:hypothetical protein
MTINGMEVDLGPYDRIESPYCNSTYGSMETIIEFGSEKLTLNFENKTRFYEL